VSATARATEKQKIKEDGDMVANELLDNRGRVVAVVLKDETLLVTLGDLRAFILKQAEHIQEFGSTGDARGLATASFLRMLSSEFLLIIRIELKIRGVS
jgi:hypothetical protein